jgi:hypothetical protein
VRQNRSGRRGGGKNLSNSEPPTELSRFTVGLFRKSPVLYEPQMLITVTTKARQLTPNLRQTNPYHISTRYFKIHFNIILHSISRSPDIYPSFFYIKFVVRIFIILYKHVFSPKTQSSFIWPPG